MRTRTAAFSPSHAAPDEPLVLAPRVIEDAVEASEVSSDKAWCSLFCWRCWWRFGGSASGDGGHGGVAVGVAVVFTMSGCTGNVLLLLPVVAAVDTIRAVAVVRVILQYSVDVV